MSLSKNVGLLDLPDEVLLRIARHIPQGDLLRLARLLPHGPILLRLGETCCARLKRICSDRSLWIRVDLIKEEDPLTPTELQLLQTLVHEDTRSIRIKGYSDYDRTTIPDPAILGRFMKRCPDLEEFGFGRGEVVTLTRCDGTKIPVGELLVRYVRMCNGNGKWCGE